jgi:hypothetical protein
MRIYYKRKWALGQRDLDLARFTEWLEEVYDDVTSHYLSGYAMSDEQKTVDNFIKLTKKYQAEYQDGLEQYYDIDLHSVYVYLMVFTASLHWSIMYVQPDEPGIVYYIIDIPDESIAVLFKLANL